MRKWCEIFESSNLKGKSFGTIFHYFWHQILLVVTQHQDAVRHVKECLYPFKTVLTYILF